MRDIIVRLLDLRKIESGMQMNITPVDLGELVDALLKGYETWLSRKNIRVDVDPSESNVKVLADEGAVKQVVDNLLSNAIKFSPHGKRIFVELSTRDGIGRCAIRDQGPGLSADDQAGLFKKFVRLSAKPTDDETSTGLGLSIVKKMVESMKGDVRARSAGPGQGATFEFDLPLASGC